MIKFEFLQTEALIKCCETLLKHYVYLLQLFSKCHEYVDRKQMNNFQHMDKKINKSDTE